MTTTDTNVIPPTNQRAIRWTGDNFDQVHAFICAGTNWTNHDADESGCCWADPCPPDIGNAVYDWTRDRWIDIQIGDWVVLGSDNQHFPMSPDGVAR
jgi:hypothetical protein